MSFGDNTLTPFEIVDAREAARKASEQQKSVEDQIRKRSRRLAEAEARYRERLSVRIMELKTEEGIAWTVCSDVARGEEDIAQLRKARDICQGLLESVQQQGFRYGADRRDLHKLIEWSERRDLRTDAEPDWSRTPTFGRPVPDNVDPKTGELREVA